MNPKNNLGVTEQVFFTSILRCSEVNKLDAFYWKNKCVFLRIHAQTIINPNATTTTDIATLSLGL